MGMGVAFPCKQASMNQTVMLTAAKSNVRILNTLRCTAEWKRTCDKSKCQFWPAGISFPSRPRLGMAPRLLRCTNAGTLSALCPSPPFSHPHTSTKQAVSFSLCFPLISIFHWSIFLLTLSRPMFPALSLPLQVILSPCRIASWILSKWYHWGNEVVCNGSRWSWEYTWISVHWNQKRKLQVLLNGS